MSFLQTTYNRACRRMLNRYPSKLNFSIKIPRLFLLEKSRTWTKSENELMEYLYTVCDPSTGIVQNYEHYKTALSFNMPIESYMRAFRKLADKDEFTYIDSKKTIFLKDYQKMHLTNPIHHKDLPLEEQKNLGGYITVSIKPIISGINRLIRPRAKRILLYLLARIGKRKESLKFDQKKLCEIFGLMPCELNSYIYELIHVKAVHGEFNDAKKQWEFALGDSVVDKNEDTLSFLMDLKNTAPDIISSLTSQILKMLIMYQFTTKFKISEAMTIVNLACVYGVSAIDDIMFRLRSKIDYEKEWPKNIIGYITNAAKRNTNTAAQLT
ncbi:hypothetical protein BHU72_14570 [Desulfuribacillus stibiiarsenatis]|uniref:Uncharacterized protein n=1 Tax=Desulfuribacillus stibiiarsenatis TaxID=1390249 RepID=A0A1E5L7E0_9FIRM|nr:hypothetical protein [Desulfuribacillus stibiiarsenatis]OEH86051.1 hypothetical protein BHU72_14570 [Desulfuribacillus stibiiarsenatis]